MVQKRSASVLFAGVLALSVSALPGQADTLIHSFEGGTLATPTNAAAVGGAASHGFSTTGVTHGSSSYSFVPVIPTNPNDTARLLIQFDFTQQVLDALQANPVIRFDVTLGADPNPSDTESGLGMNWATNQSVGGGFNFGSFYTGFLSFGSGPSTVEITLSAALVDSLDDLSNPGEFAQFFIGVTPPANITLPTVYLDNVRVVAIPEPGTLAGLGLAGLALLRRRPH